MVSMSQLWIPILLSAVAVFIASSIIHMASPWHKTDYPRMENETQVMDALRPLALRPGDYFFPRPASMADMKSAEFIERTQRGPVVLMTVMPNDVMPMGPLLAKWFVYVIVVSMFAAFVTAAALPRGAPGHLVFHEAALVAFAGYALALWQLSIWYRRSLSITIKSTVDAIIYAAITGAVFVWLWPA
jgi:hypothetical protein